MARKSNISKGLMVALLGIMGACLAVVIASPAQAKSLAMSTVNSVLGSQKASDGCNTCVVVPAIVTIVNNSSSSSTSHVHIVVHKTVKENVHEFEQINHVVVGFNMMPSGLPPSQQHSCKVGDFAWSGWKTIDGKTVYTKNVHHGRTHACWDGHNWRQIGGGPGQWNCGNIVMERKPHAMIVPRVVGFRTMEDFTSTFDRLVKKQNSASSTSTKQTTYACPAGFNSVPGDVTRCQNCPPCPTTTSVTTTVPTTTTVHTTTTVPTTTTVVTTTTTPPVTFTMVFDTINDIPAGICRPEILHVTSSVAGQVQISPNIGLISTVDCYRPNNERLSMVKLPVNTGSQDLTVYVYEPTDSSATSDTLTAVPLITGVDAKNNTATTSFTVSHPTRP